VDEETLKWMGNGDGDGDGDGQKRKFDTICRVLDRTDGQKPSWNET
jgi:hypothetical protein